MISKVGAGDPTSNAVILSRDDLLAIFDSNPGRAEDKYLALYRKLVRYFAWKRQSDPEDLAQEALKRGLNRLQCGQRITTDNPESYFFGVARNLVREGWATMAEEQLDLHKPGPFLSSFRNLHRVEQRIFLAECLGGLPEDESAMLMAYAQGEGLAWTQKTGLPPATLRSRIHRLRKRLETLASRPVPKVSR